MLALAEELVPGDAYVGRANELAGELMRRLEELGVYRRERRGWLPHVTVARFRIQPKLTPELPDLGLFSPSEVAALFFGAASVWGAVRGTGIVFARPCLGNGDSGG